MVNHYGKENQWAIVLKHDFLEININKAIVDFCIVYTKKRTKKCTL